MKELNEDNLLPKKPTLLDNIKLYKPYILISIVLLLILWHIFELLIGNKSVLVLLELREQEKELQNNVEFYQKQNAALQREIFEIVGE